MRLVTAKIDTIENINYDGPVFNVDLESTRKKSEDDLFWVCNNIVVHNCFPKDLNALMSLSRDLGVNPTVLNAVWMKNLEVRSSKDRDWEKMHGRAVSVKKK